MRAADLNEPRGNGEGICLDLTTSWLHRDSRPTGILRVEHEMARYLRRTDATARFVVFDRRADWPRVMPAQVVDSLLDRDPDEVADANSLLRTAERFKGPLLALARAAHLEERARAVLRNREDARVGPPRAWERLEVRDIGLYLFLGVGWERPVLPFLSRLKAAWPRPRVAAMAYDLIPMVRPELCQPHIVELFPRTAEEMTWAADIIFCISQATQDDLRRIGDERGWRVPRTTVVHLGDEVPGEAGVMAQRPRFPVPDRFVLMVGTIEPRKNHDLAYRLWRRLAEQRPELAVPLLWVGARGWNTGDLLTRAAADPMVSSGLVRVLHGVPDSELNWLYDRALFTIFPSHYEGWGLPIREALAHGKVCLAGTGSSLEEAGAGLAIHRETFDQEAWLAEVVRLLGDDGYRAAIEAGIRTEYRARSWDAACGEMLAAARGDHGIPKSDDASGSAGSGLESLV